MTPDLDRPRQCERNRSQTSPSESIESSRSISFDFDFDVASNLLEKVQKEIGDYLLVTKIFVSDEGRYVLILL